jgi:hypothetical protein
MKSGFIRLVVRIGGLVLLFIGVLRAGFDLAHSAQVSGPPAAEAGAGHVQVWISFGLADLGMALVFIGALMFCGSFSRPTKTRRPGV